MQHPEESAEHDGAGHCRVLLVEDQEAVRGLVRQILARNGYEVHEAADGRQALQALEAIDGTVDLVVTDVVMPHMGGPEFVARARETVPDLPALFISGYADGDALPGYHDDPCTDFLQKPFTLDDLREKVQELLRADPSEA